jgi:hypothetical protein
MSSRRVGSAPQRWRGTTPLDVTLDWLGAVAATEGARTAARDDSSIGLRARCATAAAALLRLRRALADRALHCAGAELARSRRDLSPASPRRLSFKVRSPRAPEAPLAPRSVPNWLASPLHCALRRSGRRHAGNGAPARRSQRRAVASLPRRAVAASVEQLVEL